MQQVTETTGNQQLAKKAKGLLDQANRKKGGK
jgi:hypothetical protein